MNIETERLIIRDFTADDGEDLYEYLSDAAVLEFEPCDVFSREAAYNEAVRRAEDKNFSAICLKDSGKLIGNIYIAEQEFLTWETGYVFNRNYHRMGYATEALGAVMAYIFANTSAHRIIAMCDPMNIASWKLMEKVGMRRESVQYSNVFFHKDNNGEPIWKDTYQYAILKSEFAK